MKKWLVIGLGMMSAVSFAQTLTVTAPTNNQFLRSNNTLTFNGRGGRVQVTVSATITGPGGSSVVSTTAVPSQNGDFAGSLSLNFTQTSAQGSYTVVVRCTEPGQTYAPTTLSVTVDTRNPKLLEFRPAQNSFVRAAVPIRFKLLEDNMKDWRVTINNADIPNNSGTTERDIALNWDPTTLETDGPQTIGLAVRDQANNPLNFSIPITLDRRPPRSTIQYPLASTPIRRGSDLLVIVDVVDQFSNSVDVTGIDVRMVNMNGVLITRVPRESWRASGANTSRWTGRIRSRVQLPSQFKIVVTSVDKAGNNGSVQEVTVRPTN
jgi:hypothetical protein